MARSAVVQIVLKATDLTRGAFAAVGAQATALKTRIAGAFSGINGALAGLGFGITFGAAATYLIRVNAEFQRLQARLQTFTGSAAGARVVLDQLTAFADRTPFDLQDTTDAFLQMRLAGIQPTLETLQHLGDLATANGVKLATIGDAIRDATTGNVRGLKQLGITAQVAGDQITLSFRGQQTTIENSTVAITNYLEELGKTEFTGAMANQATTLGEALQDVTEAFDRLARSTGQSGFTGTMVQAAQALSGFISDLGDGSTKVGFWANLITTWVGSTIRVVWNMIRYLVNVFDLLWINTQKVALSIKLVWLQVRGALGGDVDAAVTATMGQLERLDARARATSATIAETSRNAKQAILDLAGAMSTAAQAHAAAHTAADAFVSGLLGLGKTGKAVAEGTTAVTTATQSATAALAERAQLLLPLAADERTRGTVLYELLAIEDALAEAVRDGTLSLEDRAAALQALQAIEAQRKARGKLPEPAKPVAPRVVDDEGNLIPGAVPTFEQMGGPDVGKYLAELEANKVAEQMAHLTDLASIFGDAWSQAWEAFGAGAISASEAMLQSMKGALAGIAKHEAQLALLEGAKQLAAAIGAFGTPAAAKHFTSAAKYFAVGAALSAFAGALGGGGGGGGGVRGGGSASSTARDSEEYRKRGNTAQGTIIIEGGLLDMNDPRQADAFTEAVNRLSGEGRIVVVRGSRG